MASAGNNATGLQHQSLSLLASLNHWREVEDVLKPYWGISFRMNSPRRNRALDRKLKDIAGFIDGDYCDGLTLIHRVVSQPNVPDRDELLKKILSLGCDPDAPTKDGVGMRPSHLCIKYRSYECLRSLSYCRADLFAKVESNGKTNFDLVSDFNSWGAMPILLEKIFS